VTGVLTTRSYPLSSNFTIIEPEGSVSQTTELGSGEYYEAMNKLLYKVSEYCIIT
jgi:hypothetical protein